MLGANVWLVLGIVYGIQSGHTISSLHAPPVPRPNIVFVFADDLGHADIGYAEGSHQTPTPNIDKLAWDGIILNRHYTNPACTPSRAALLTGRYTFQIGMQDNPIVMGEPWGLPLNFKLMPQHFKDLGYSTVFFGKWHIGSMTRDYLPNARGFDYWLGNTEGDAGNFNYMNCAFLPYPAGCGRNLYENGYQVPRNCTNNYYYPHMITEKFEQIIHTHNFSQPLYVQFSTPIPRGTQYFDTAKNRSWQGMTTMPQYNLHPAVAGLSSKFPERKRQLANIQALDEQMRRIVIALTYKGVINNTIIAFVSDNGAPSRSSGYQPGVPYVFSNFGSNWPLRMFKATLFEGGVRTLAYIWSPLLKKQKYVTERLFHVTDWLPTLYEAAGGNLSKLGNISGISQWASLNKGERKGPRLELVNNINRFPNYAMIYTNPDDGHLYKIIGGQVFNNSFTGWDRTDGTTAEDPQVTPTKVSVNCNNDAWGTELGPVCAPWLADCLFDLTIDPCEQNNIAAVHPNITTLLRQKIALYNATAIPSASRPYDPAASPALFDDWWVPWRDRNPVLQSPPCTMFNPIDSS